MLLCTQGTIYCPEVGFRTQSQGFNRGFNPGDRTLSTKRPERAPDQTWLNTRREWVSSRELSPFQGEPRYEYFPGLKPWAESLSPLGAKKHPKPPLTSRHQPGATLFRPLWATD